MHNDLAKAHAAQDKLAEQGAAGGRRFAAPLSLTFAVTTQLAAQDVLPVEEPQIPSTPDD